MLSSSPPMWEVYLLQQTFLICTQGRLHTLAFSDKCVAIAAIAGLYLGMVALCLLMMLSTELSDFMQVSFYSKLEIRKDSFRIFNLNEGNTYVFFLTTLNLNVKSRLI